MGVSVKAAYGGNRADQGYNPAQLSENFTGHTADHSQGNENGQQSECRSNNKMDTSLVAYMAADLGLVPLSMWVVMFPEPQ